MTVLGQHDASTLAQLDRVAINADRVALMADGHLGYVMPIGGVAAYRRLDDVLAAHAGTVEVLHTLTPVIVCMAPTRTRDPYKD